MDDQRRTVFVFRAAQMCGIAQQRMQPLGEGAVGRSNTFAAAVLMMLMTPEHKDTSGFLWKRAAENGMPGMVEREALQG